LFDEDLIKTVFHPERILERVEREMNFHDVVTDNFDKYIFDDKSNKYVIWIK
jgi:hypothetical protein